MAVVAAALAFASPADASVIVYHDPVDITIQLGPGQGTNSITFDPFTGAVGAGNPFYSVGPFHISHDGTESPTLYWNIVGTNSFNSILQGTSFDAPRLMVGDVIQHVEGPAGRFRDVAYLAYPPLGFPDWEGGVRTGYLGIRMPLGYDFMYGWVQVTHDDDANTITLHDFALETTPNMAIAAGDGTGPVPEPSTMLLLGSGLAALAAWRRKRHQPAA